MSHYVLPVTSLGVSDICFQCLPHCTLWIWTIHSIIGKYPINTHYIRCIWGWLLRVPSQGYHHFPYDSMNHLRKILLAQVAIWLLRCFLEFCTALSTKTPVSEKKNGFHKGVSRMDVISPSAKIYTKTSKDIRSLLVMNHSWGIPSYN